MRTENPPIFLRPAGRTGGTLFVTMLDAHPALAMSYEIYEDRLVDDAGAPFDPARAAAMIRAAKDRDPVVWVRDVMDRNLRTFVARARRADVEVSELLEELGAFAREGGRLDTLDGRLDFIDRLMIFRMRKAGKQFWGGKAFAGLEALHRRHHGAVFFSMVRDGRDVLASRLLTGNFRTDAARCAADWRSRILEFREFMERGGARAMEVRYERLVQDPEGVLREACGLIGVAYDPVMLRFQEQDLALFRNPHGHLSHRQLREGLNDRSIGRWRSDLSRDDVAVFEAACSDLLAKYGYL